MERPIDQIIENLVEMLAQAGFTLSDVVRFTYYTTDVPSFIEANQTLMAHLDRAGCKPATSLIGGQSLSHPDCVVEIEAIAVK